MSWVAAELETLTTIFIETISESQKDKSKIIEFSGAHEQRVSYGSFMRRSYQITSDALNATESAAFIAFYEGHGNLTPFKFVYESETIYVRFDGGYIMQGTVSPGIKKSVRFSLNEVNPAEIIE
jgi:hypothetical protein